MGENKTTERSFRELNELWDQKDAPGWHNARVGLSVELLHVYDKLDDGAVKKKELCITREIGGRAHWIFPVQVTGAVIAGLSKAVVYSHPALLDSPNGHIVRKILLQQEIAPSIRSVVVEAAGRIKQRDKLIIAAKYRWGKNEHGIRVAEKLAILSDCIAALMLPIAKVPPLIELYQRLLLSPPPISVFGSERKKVIGVVV